MKNKYIITKFDDVNLESILLESRWEDAKNKLSKLGMIKKGGKFFGRKKQDAKAREEFDAILKDVRNTVIKQLNDTIIEKYPGFPNNKSRDEFLVALGGIAKVYDSICQFCLRTYGAPDFPKKNEEGYPIPVLEETDRLYLDINMANSLIRGLRKYLQKIIDYDLSTAYTVFEACEIEELTFDDFDEDDINEEISLNPFKWFKKKTDDKTNQEVSSQEVDKTIKDTSILSGGKETFTKKEVESKKKEAIIAALGAALGIFGWILQTEWFKSILEGWLNKPEVDSTDVQSSIQEINFNVEKGDGFTQTINKMCATTLGPNTSTSEFISAMKERGFGSTPDEIVKNLGMQSASPNPNFNADMTRALSGGGSLKEVFTGALSGKGGSLLMLKPGPFIAKKITNTIVKVIVKKAVTTGTVVAGKAAGLGSVLAPLGIGLIAGALTSYLLKRKAKKSSRYKDLQGVLENLDELMLNKDGIYYVDKNQKVMFVAKKIAGPEGENQKAIAEPEGEDEIAGPKDEYDRERIEKTEKDLEEAEEEYGIELGEIYYYKGVKYSGKVKTIKYSQRRPGRIIVKPLEGKKPPIVVKPERLSEIKKESFIITKFNKFII
jgi:hypothetical protein